MESRVQRIAGRVMAVNSFLVHGQSKPRLDVPRQEPLNPTSVQGGITQ